LGKGSSRRGARALAFYFLLLEIRVLLRGKQRGSEGRNTECTNVLVRQVTSKNSCNARKVVVFLREPPTDIWKSGGGGVAKGGVEINLIFTKTLAGGKLRKREGSKAGGGTST